MNIDEYLEKIENVEREYIPAFSALKPKRKISLLETDIKDFLRARKRANYYQSVKDNNKVLEELYYNEVGLEQRASARARLRVKALTDAELHMYVDMLEDKLYKARDCKIPGRASKMYDFITAGCLFGSVVENDIIKTALVDVRNQCDDLLNCL